MVLLLSIIFPSFLMTCNGARILGIVPTPCYSHQIVFRPLWRELSLRGHQVTVLTTDPMKNTSLTNLTEIDLHFAYDIKNEIIADLVQCGDENIYLYRKTLHLLMSKIIYFELAHENVQRIIKNKSEHFNLVIAEHFFPTAFAFSERFNCPFIGVRSFEGNVLNHAAIGNPSHPVLNPDYILPYSNELTFIQRIQSVLLDVVSLLYYYAVVLPTEDSTVKKCFGEGYPSLKEIENKMSLLFINTHVAFQKVRPSVPTVVQIGGGTHIQLTGKLSEDLKIFLDTATYGVVYFSLGTSVQNGHISKETLNIILEAFSGLPYKVLWKTELNNITGKPNNVMAYKWLPQSDILCHPNIRLFITQGGMQSIDEAIYCGVPMLGIPFFADQFQNIKRIEHLGIGLYVNHKTIDRRSFKRSILELINNSKYRNKTKESSNLMLDQPMTGLERAVWWTEYVLRHNGAQHLRSPLLDIPTYQYYLLDVIGVLLFAIIAIAYLFNILVKLLIKLIKPITSKLKVE